MAPSCACEYITRSNIRSTGTSFYELSCVLQSWTSSRRAEDCMDEPVGQEATEFY